MWTRLKSMSQIRRLQEDAELLHEPLPGSTNGTYHSGNNVYKVKKIDGDTVVLYQTGHHEGKPYYSSRGFRIDELVNGQWSYKAS